MRNLFKIGAPWQLGHIVAVGLATQPSGAVPPWLWALTVTVYLLLGSYVAALFMGSRRTPYDIVAGTDVRRSSDIVLTSPPTAVAN